MVATPDVGRPSTPPDVGEGRCEHSQRGMGGSTNQECRFSHCRNLSHGAANRLIRPCVAA